MKIKQNELSQRANRCAKIAPSKPVLPIISHIKLTLEDNTLTMVCTDLSEFIVERIDVDAPDEKFDCCVPAKKFANLVGSMSGEIELIYKRNKLYIKKGKKEAKLTAMETNEFPIVPELPDVNPVTIKASELVYLITNTVYAVSTDANRPILNGVNFKFGEQTCAFAADGLRMAYCEHNLDVELPDVIVPASFLVTAVSTLKSKKDDVDVYTTDKQMIFELPETRLVTQLITGNMIDHNIFINETTNNRVEIKTKQLKSVLDTLNQISSETGNVIVMEYQTDKLIFFADGGQSGDADDEIECDVQGDLFKTAFNGLLMCDVLAVCGDDIVIKQKNANRPVWICPLNREQEEIHIIMPLQVREKQTDS